MSNGGGDGDTEVLPGGTALPTQAAREVDFDWIGRGLVFDVLSPGAGEGPDPQLVNDLGGMFAHTLAFAVDLFVKAGVGANPVEVLRRTLDLSEEAYPNPEDLQLPVRVILAEHTRTALGDAVGIQASKPAEEPDLAALLKGLPATQLPGQTPPPDPLLGQDDQKLMQQAGMKATAAAGWTIAGALTWLGRCAKDIDGTVWRARFGWAGGLQAAGVAAELAQVARSPSTDDGNKIHGKVQEQFLKHYGPGSTRNNEVLIERTIHRQRGSISIAKASKEGGRYQRLWIALHTPRMPTPQSRLRLDLVDLGTMSLWEVKPIGDLVAGVVQLLFYSSAYNCVAKMANASDRLVPSPVKLDPSVTMPVKLDTSKGRPRFAFLFERKEIPGLVGYVVFVLPSLKDLRNAAAIELIRRLVRELRRLRGQRGLDDDGLAAGAAGAVVLVIASVLLFGAAAAAAEALAALAGLVGEAAVTSGAAAAARGLLLTGGAAAAAPGSQPPAEPGDAGTLPGAVPGSEVVTLETFAGTIICQDANQALAVLQALAWRMVLDMGQRAEPIQ